MAVNYLDLVFVALLLGYGIKGYKKGFFHEFVGVIGYFLALFLALRATTTLTQPASQMFNSPAGVSAVVVFGLVFLGIMFLYKFVEKWLHKNASLKLPDLLHKSLGTAVGLIKGMLLASLLALMAALLPVSAAITQQVHDSGLQRSVAGLAPVIYDATRGLTPGSKTFVEYLEIAFNAFDKTTLDRATLDVLVDLGSKKALEWKTTIAK